MLVESNEPEHSEAWVHMSLLSRIVSRALGFGRFSWHYADDARRPSWLLRTYARWPIEPFNLLIDAFVDVITIGVLWLMRLCGVHFELAPSADADTDEQPASPAPEKALQAAHGGVLTRRQSIIQEAWQALREEGNEDAAAKQPAPVSAPQALAAPLAPCEPSADAPTAVALGASMTRPLPAHGTHAWDWHVLRRRKHAASKEVRRRLARVHGSRLSSSSSVGAGDMTPRSSVVQTAEEIAATHAEEYVIAVRARVMRSIGLGGIYVSTCAGPSSCGSPSRTAASSTSCWACALRRSSCARGSSRSASTTRCSGRQCWRRCCAARSSSSSSTACGS
jgi:hypothetical protein